MYIQDPQFRIRLKKDPLICWNVYNYCNCLTDTGITCHLDINFGNKYVREICNKEIDFAKHYSRSEITKRGLFQVLYLQCANQCRLTKEKRDSVYTLLCIGKFVCPRYRNIISIIAKILHKTTNLEWRVVKSINDEKLKIIAKLFLSR